MEKMNNQKKIITYSLVNVIVLLLLGYFTNPSKIDLSIISAPLWLIPFFILQGIRTLVNDPLLFVLTFMLANYLLRNIIKMVETKKKK